MKISMKILAASVALASLGMSGAANASIAIATAKSGSSEMFLTAWDQVGLQSYSRDLGVFESTMMADPNKPLSYNLNTLDTGAADTNWTTFINSGNKGAGVVYTVTGSDITDFHPGFGVLTTSPSTMALITPSISTQSKLVNVGQSITLWAKNLNSDAGDNATTTTSVNLSSYATSTDTSKIGYFDNPFWGINEGGKTFLTIGDINHSVAFYAVAMKQDATGNWNPGLTKLHNVWTLDTTGKLTYAPSAVPVPAALWLFGSGLLGLVSIARRRKV